MKIYNNHINGMP